MHAGATTRVVAQQACRENGSGSRQGEGLQPCFVVACELVTPTRKGNFNVNNENFVPVVQNCVDQLFFFLSQGASPWAPWIRPWIVP